MLSVWLSCPVRGPDTLSEDQGDSGLVTDAAGPKKRHLSDLSGLWGQTEALPQTRDVGRVAMPVSGRSCENAVGSHPEGLSEFCL